MSTKKENKLLKNIVNLPQPCPYPFPQSLFQETYICTIISLYNDKLAACSISMQDFHIYYSSADIFSHIHMQTENKRAINLKKDEYAKKFSI